MATGHDMDARQVYKFILNILICMIKIKDKPDSSKDIKELLHPFVREWFFKKFKDFSLPQLYSILEVHSRNNILVSAPTGSGKTLSSMLAILNELIDSSERGVLEDRIYCIGTSIHLIIYFCHFHFYEFLFYF